MDSRAVIKDDIKDVISALGADVNRLSGKTVLITGPSGLLGSYLVDTIAELNDRKILEYPCRVIGLSRSPVTPLSRLGHLLGRTDMNFIVHDVAQPLPLKEKIDFIIHAAGRSAPAIFQADPLGTIDVNIGGIRWLLDYAKDSNVESVLYMSSGEIYGNPPPEFIPTSETYAGNVSPLSPRACYIESKRLAETLCLVYWEQFGVPAKIARPFIVYGPGLLVEDRRVMADFMRLGIEGKPITMLTSGEDTRSYCYIADASVVFWKILFSNYNGEPFNVASDMEEVSIKELAELIHRICGIHAPVGVPKIQNKDIAFLSASPHRVKPDISKIRERFAFNPRIGLAEGMRRTINWNLLRMGKPALS